MPRWGRRCRPGHVCRGAVGPRGGPAGDLYVHLRVRNHDRFARDGSDLHTTLLLPYTQAALGASIDFETLDGTEEIDIPRGTASGTTFRLRGRGVPHLERRSRGDLLIEVGGYHRTATPDTFALHDAQFVLARSYGFESWPKLKAAVEGVTTKRLHEAVQKGDLGAVRALLARRPEIVDLLREGPSGFEIRAIHIAVMARDVEMTRLLLEAGADTRDGIWPNRDATSPRTIAEERGYDEIVALMTAQEEKRGARSVNAHGDGVRRLSDAMMTGGEEAVIAVFESEPGLAGMCPPDGVTMLHRAAQYGLLRVATWLLDHGADVNKPSQPDFLRWKGRTPLEFDVWEYAADSARSAREATAALLIEHGASQGAAVRKLAMEAGLGGIETRRDLASIERVTAGTMPRDTLESPR